MGTVDINKTMNNKNLNQKILDDFLELIENSEFKIVFKKFSFKQRHKSYNVNDGRHYRYCIIYETKTCKLGFFYELGGGTNVQISTISVGSQKSLWLDIVHVMSYLLKEPTIMWNDKISYSRNEAIKADLSTISTRFLLLSDQIIDMFKDSDTVSIWKPKIDEYVREDIRRRYELQR